MCLLDGFQMCSIRTKPEKREGQRKRERESKILSKYNTVPFLARPPTWPESRHPPQTSAAVSQAARMGGGGINQKKKKTWNMRRVGLLLILDTWGPGCKNKFHRYTRLCTSWSASRPPEEILFRLPAQFCPALTLSSFWSECCCSTTKFTDTNPPPPLSLRRKTGSLKHWNPSVWSNQKKKSSLDSGSE